ncbi:MAG TPA: alpha/beta hydrolase [Dehalococcoidia bacterium]
MNRRTILAIGSGIAAIFALRGRRRLRLNEDLEWASLDKPGKVIDIDGYGVHHVEQGTGPAIVLIHGFGGHTYHYRRMIPSLAREHRVIAVDLKGFGYSERDANAGLSHEDQVAMLKKLLRRLDVDRALFVGHSMGGAVVQRLAAHHPEMVDGLVLIASVSGGAEEARIRRRMKLPPAPIARRIIPYFGKFAASRLLGASFYDSAYLSDDIRAEYLRPGRIKGSMDGLLAMMRDGAHDPDIDQSKITMPVLIVNGAQDRIVPLSMAQKIRKRIPQARLVVIEHAKHAVVDERAEECSRAILDFLRDSASEIPTAASAR